MNGFEGKREILARMLRGVLRRLRPSPKPCADDAPAGDDHRPERTSLLDERLASGREPQDVRCRRLPGAECVAAARSRLLACPNSAYNIRRAGRVGSDPPFRPRRRCPRGSGADPVSVALVLCWER